MKTEKYLHYNKYTIFNKWSDLYEMKMEKT